MDIKRRGGSFGSYVPRTGFLDWCNGRHVFLGGMKETALLFLAQTGFFVLVSYLKLSERMYMYIFGAYLTIFFAGFTYYTTFILTPGFGE